jgi:hypothetical protein
VHVLGRLAYKRCDKNKEGTEAFRHRKIVPPNPMLRRKTDDYSKRCEYLRTITKCKTSFVSMNETFSFRAPEHIVSREKDHRNYDLLYYNAFYDAFMISNYEKMFDIGKRLYYMSSILNNAPKFLGKRKGGGEVKLDVDVVAGKDATRSGSFFSNERRSVEIMDLEKDLPPSPSEIRTSLHVEGSSQAFGQKTFFLNLKNHVGKNETLWNQVSLLHADDLDKLIRFLKDIERNGVKYLFHNIKKDKRGLESTVNNNGRLVLSRYQ